MEIVRTLPNSVCITLNEREVLLIVGSIRESIECLDEWDYPIRVGVAIADARTQLSQWHQILNELVRTNNDSTE